jgi:hypothetical protein
MVFASYKFKVVLYDRVMSQNSNGNQNASQWSQIIGQILDKLSGTNMSTTVGFDNLEVDMPRAKGPDGKDLGSAKWVINGKLLWTTQASKKE